MCPVGFEGSGLLYACRTAKRNPLPSAGVRDQPDQFSRAGWESILKDFFLKKYLFIFYLCCVLLLSRLSLAVVRGPILQLRCLGFSL